MKPEPTYWAEPTGKFAAIPAHARMDVDLPIYTVPLCAIPPGYKLVPVEPTEAMLEAGMDAPRKDSDTFLCVWREDVAKVYKAMIAAIEGEQ